MATEQPGPSCNRLVGHDDNGREIVCGKAVPGHPLHLEINGAKALDLVLCAEHKAEWYAHNEQFFGRAQAAKVALQKLFEDHRGDLFTTAEIRNYLRDVLKNRDELLRGKAERDLVTALQDKGKLSFAVEDLFKEVRRREEELSAPSEWEEVTPSKVRNYLNAALDNRDERLSGAEFRLIAGMPQTGMPGQPLMELYARLRREDMDRSDVDDPAVSK
ncbi:hypothetical protein [Streptomyces sp. CB03238]|uniref:hypothetical protein n=1 Tax=Streptomyces sp. CB03238 TaxID=1907777 RepID=UPI00118158CD|nr:hypothetical protein [Streptomyces sp. CB03238]